MFCVKLFAVAGVLLLALGTAQSQFKNRNGFLEQEEKLDYKDMIIKKLLMKLNDVLRDRRQGEELPPPQPQPPQGPQQQLLSPLPPKTLIPQHQHLQQIQLAPPCLQQIPPPHIQQLPPPQLQQQIHRIHPIPQSPQVRPGLKHAQQLPRPAEQQQPRFQPPSGCQIEYEEIPCPCGGQFGDCPCCQDVQYEEVPCLCCEQQPPFQDPFVIPAGNRPQPAGTPRVIQTGPIFTETFVSSSEDGQTESESPETEQSCNCCMSQGPITHLPTQRCSHCTQQPQLKTLPQQPQQQPTQQVLMVPGRTQVQAVIPHALHPSFFTGFTPDEARAEERIVQKTPFMHPKLNELLHASHGDTC